MSQDFLQIGFTLPGFLPEGIEAEASRITQMLDSGIDIFHIRKPDADTEQVRELIQAIPADYHSRLLIHYHFALTEEFGLGGVHLNSRNPVPPDNAAAVTRSCHSLEELRLPLPDGSMPEYQTLSPIFDSISKPGYESRFNLSTLRPHIQGLRAVALGGVTPDRFRQLQEAGFIGAAMLGCLWK